MRLLGFVIQSILAGGGYLASFLCSREYRNHIVEEQRWWQSHLMCGSELTGIVLFSQLVVHYPEYVNLYLYRLRRYSTIARIAGGCGLLFFKKQQSLYIATASIGWNLIIQHGFSTVIAAKSIGYNCWINQQVTIGYSFEENPPTIGNGCIVCAGAKVIGDVKLGDNAIVGANAVVTHDVLENEVVGGVPAKKIGTNACHRLFLK